MLLLIDAYNLLHHSDVLERGRGTGWLQRARQRLVHQLALHLDATLAAETCLVFDAQDPPPDLPDRYRIESIRLFYAVGYPEADDLIEELIARHPTPRRLTVISSDHRIQRAAARRGATFFDADVWYDELCTRGPRLAIPWPPAADAPAEAAEKPAAPATAAEVAQWYEHFSLQVPATLTDPEVPKPVPEKREKPPKSTSPKTQKPSRQSKAKAKAPPKPPPKKPSNAAPKASLKAKPKAAKRVVPRPPKSQRPPPPVRNPHRPLDPNQDNPFPEGYGEDIG